MNDDDALFSCADIIASGYLLLIIMAQKRIQKELLELEKEPLGNCSACPLL